MSFGEQVVSAKILNKEIAGRRAVGWVGGLLDMNRLIETPIRTLRLI